MAIFRKCILTLLICSVAVGCATSSEPVTVSHDESSNQTIYETDKIQLQNVELTSGLSRENHLYVRVIGECVGEDCVPSEYVLAFEKKGTQPVQIPGRDIRLTVGTETMKWTDPQNRSLDQTSEIRSGTFVKVTLSSKQLSTLANVSEVTGAVGGMGFEIPYENRSPLRELLSRLDATATAQEGGEES